MALCPHVYTPPQTLTPHNRPHYCSVSVALHIADAKLISFLTEVSAHANISNTRPQILAITPRLSLRSHHCDVLTNTGALGRRWLFVEPVSQ